MRKGDLFKADGRYFICEHKTPSYIIAKLLTNGKPGRKFFHIHGKVKLIVFKHLQVSPLIIKRIQSIYCQVFDIVELRVNKTSMSILGKKIYVIRLYSNDEYVYITYSFVTYDRNKNVFILHEVKRC